MASDLKSEEVGRKIVESGTGKSIWDSMLGLISITKCEVWRNAEVELPNWGACNYGGVYFQKGSFPKFRISKGLPTQQ
jgi:hypothetical protein